MQPVKVNFLVTKQDFYEWNRALSRAQLRRWEVMLCRFMGICFMLLGALGIGFLPGTAAKTACALLVVLSTAVGLYYDTLYPYLIHRRTAALWESASPKTYRIGFSEQQVTVDCERYCARLPYAMLCGVYEDRHVILLDIGAGQLYFVPKRTLTGDEQQRLQQHLKHVMKEKYKQEGVR